MPTFKIDGLVAIAMPTWRDLVHREIHDLIHGRDEPNFTRQELLVHGADAFRAKSTGKTPENTVSRVLQELRDSGVLEFVQPGEYRVLVSGDGESETRWATPGLQRPPVREATYTEVKRLSRDFQNHLRSHVIPNFHHACGVCGLSPEWFLDAAHLRPVRDYPNLAGDAGAAVALCGNHHKAMDSGALTIEKDLHLTVVPPDDVGVNAELDRTLTAYDGKQLRAPRWHLTPNALPSLPARDLVTARE